MTRQELKQMVDRYSKEVYFKQDPPITVILLELHWRNTTLYSLGKSSCYVHDEFDNRIGEEVATKRARRGLVNQIEEGKL